MHCVSINKMTIVVNVVSTIVTIVSSCSVAFHLCMMMEGNSQKHWQIHQ
ncbi:MAG: hypothetical protein JNG43_05420 [Prevotellamassilia sp.]|nr:hypothetical protein [Prevotellamassilia sp.]CDA44056.1 unknown [Prevotella sp. CAG:5226]